MGSELDLDVAPFVGSWIETIESASIPSKKVSLPSWERGLKHELMALGSFFYRVAPFVGAWIETSIGNL